MVGCDGTGWLGEMFFIVSSKAFQPMRHLFGARLIFQKATPYLYYFRFLSHENKKKRRIPSTLEYVKQPQRLRKREAVKIIRGMCSHLIGGGGGVVVVVVSAVIVEILLPIDLIDAFKINTLWRSVLCY